MTALDAAVLVVRLSAGCVAAAGIAACAARGSPDSADTRERPVMDLARLCDVHELMMAGSSPAEQQTMLEQHLKAIHGFVDHQMVARHRKAMTENCPAGSQGRQ